MKKKLLSLTLTLAMCLGLTIPAFAAETLTGNQLYPAGDWGNGPSLTLKGVTAERETPDLQLSYCYDVAVGGSLVLDMPFPAGKDRHYTIMPASVYIPSNMKDYVDDYIGEDWEIPKQSEGGEFDASSGKTQYVYNFTEADRGASDGFDKAIYMHIYWEDSAGSSDYPLDYGSVRFLIHVVPAQPGQPAGTTASPTNDKLEVNGNAADPTVYKINGSNYFKIRDVAALLNGTEKQFSVGYDGTKNAVTATTGQGYEKQSGDLAGAAAGGDQAAAASNDAIYVDGQKIEAEVYKINGSNYFKLRDLGKALNFYVGWEAQRGVYIETNKPYSE